MTAQMYYSFIHHPSLFPPLIILSPAKTKEEKKKGEHGLYFSVSANVMCRSVTEAVQTGKDAFSA